MFKSELSLLKNENTRQETILKENTKDTIKDMMKSFSVFNINSYDKEVIRRDLIGMAQELELRGSSLEESIGESPQEFIEEIKTSSGGPNRTEILLGFLIKLSSIFFLSFGLLSLLAFGSFTWESNKVIFLLYIGVSLIGFIGEEIISPKYSMEKGDKKGIPVIFSLILFVSLTYIVFLLNDKENTIKIPAGGIMAISGLGYFVFNYLNIKNIEKLAKGKKNFIADLLNKV